MPLSKSTFTVMSLCVSTFSIPTLSHTFLNILNVLLISLCSLSSLVALFRAFVHVLPCCAFAPLGHTTTPQFYHGCFFSILYSRHKIFLFSSSNIFSSTTVSFLLHFVHLTLLLSLLFLYFHAPRQLSHYTFFNLSLEIKSCSQFSSVLVPLQLYSLYSTNIITFYLVLHPLSSIATLL